MEETNLNLKVVSGLSKLYKFIASFAYFRNFSTYSYPAGLFSTYLYLEFFWLPIICIDIETPIVIVSGHFLCRMTLPTQDEHTAVANYQYHHKLKYKYPMLGVCRTLLP